MSTKELINPKHDLSNPDLDLNNFSDKDLYHLCQRYGNGIKILRRIFAVLLVEVNRRKLHRKYGFEGIYEFAAKFGGMNKLLVEQVLCVANALKDKPHLWRAFKIDGWSKVRVVIGVATTETDKIWAEKIHCLSKPALEELVRAWRKQNEDKNHNENFYDFINSGNSKNLTTAQMSVFDTFPKNAPVNPNLPLLKPKNEMVPVFGERNSNNATVQLNQNLSLCRLENGRCAYVKMRFKVTQETEFKFLLFKQKLCKKRKEAMTSGEVLAILLEMAN